MRVSTPRSLLLLLFATALAVALTPLGIAPASAAAVAGTYEEDSSSIEYTGKWTSLRSMASSGWAIRYASGGSSASLTFTGDSVTWYTWKSANAGVTEVFIDGVSKAIVDNYSSRVENKVVGYSESGLGSGTHTIQIVSTGTANPASGGTLIHLDSFVVTGQGEATPPPAPEPDTPEPSPQPTEEPAPEPSPSVEPETTPEPIDEGDQAVDAVGVGTYEESSEAITYSGRWTTLSSRGSSGGAIRYATSTASASLTFVGDEITWYTWKSPSAGRVQVSVDGVVKATIDNYSSTTTTMVTYTASGLGAGVHTVQISSTGTANPSSSGKIIHLDAFVVADSGNSNPPPTSDPEPSPAPEPSADPEPEPEPSPDPEPDAGVTAGTYEESSSAITFTGNWARLTSAGSSGGAMVYASASASASLTFSGPTITWYTWKSPNAGKVQVYLDGVLKATVDNYASSTATKIRGFTARDLSSGPHTITIKSSGTANSASSGKMTHFDSFVVGEPLVEAAEVPPVLAADCPAATVTVSNSTELTAALAGAGPGASIHLAPGTYTRGFLLSASGTPEAPIWVCGPRSAVVQGISTTSGTALRVENAHHVRLAGFTVNKALQGVMVKYSSNISIAELNVKDVGYEAIHLYAFTTDSTVIGNLIERPGAANLSYGEGIYIGTSQRRWAEVTGGQPDRSDRNVIAGNTIVQAGAEPIEAKEGTSGGVIRDNVIKSHRSGSRATAWVLVTGNDYLVTRNTGTDAVEHGYSSMVWGSWGLRNDFRGNAGSVDANAFGVWIQDAGSGSKAACDNWVTGATKGQTNVFCSP